MGFAGSACNGAEAQGRVGYASGIAVAVPWPPGMRVKGGLEP